MWCEGAALRDGESESSREGQFKVLVRKRRTSSSIVKATIATQYPAGVTGLVGEKNV